VDAADQGSTRMRERIESRLPQMPTAMTKIAMLLLEKPAAPLDLAITELAKQAGTSPATVTRFCRLLGYTGYVPFRVAVAADIGRGSALDSWRADIGRAFGPDDSPEQVLRALVLAQTVSLQTTADGIDLHQLSTVANTIAQCRHLDIYGIGGSGIMADEMANRLYRIGIPVHAWHEVHAALASAAIPRVNGAAMAIPNTGRTDETLEALSLASSTGAFTVAISGNPTSPIAALADVHILANASDGYLQPDDLAAKHAQLFVLDLLYLLIAQCNFSRAATMLAASAMAVSDHRRDARRTGPSARHTIDPAGHGPHAPRPRKAGRHA
jgi:DNA-binding MurR/RpiR family transcriptional regulator